MTNPQSEEHDPFNLEHFLRNLTLEPMVHGRQAPSMPPPNCRSTNTPFVMRPGGNRKLREIRTLDYLEHEVTRFFNNLSTAANGAAFKALKLATQVSTADLEKTLYYNPYEVEAYSSAIFVIERGPIKTVQQLIQMIDPDIRDLEFFTPLRSGTLNSQKIEPAYFCTKDESGGMDSVKCIVIAVPPWNFAPQDFVDFIKMDTFVDGCTSLNGLANNPPWRNADLMWAYLHDLCFTHKCHYFVVTSYEQWAFGAFSTHYTTGFVSKVYPWNARPLSILEILTYWILDACGTENTMVMEQVPEEKHIDRNVLERERSSCRQRIEAEEKLIAVKLVDPTANEIRPVKRARKDSMEDRVGWETLAQHADALFASSRDTPSKPITAELDDRDVENKPVAKRYRFAKPCTEWNKWYTVRKQNIIMKKKKKENRVSNEYAPKLVSRVRFHPPIPCYSLDVDRNNNCFRPGLLGFKAFHPPLR